MVFFSSLLCRGAPETTALWLELAVPLTVDSEILVLGVAEDTYKIHNKETEKIYTMEMMFCTSREATVHFQHVAAHQGVY